MQYFSKTFILMTRTSQKSHNIIVQYRHYVIYCTTNIHDSSASPTGWAFTFASQRIATAMPTNTKSCTLFMIVLAVSSLTVQSVYLQNFQLVTELMHNHEMNQRHKKVLNTRRSTLVMIQKCIGIIIMLQITGVMFLVATFMIIMMMSLA